MTIFKNSLGSSSLGFLGLALPSFLISERDFLISKILVVEVTSHSTNLVFDHISYEGLDKQGEQGRQGEQGENTLS